ncbi:MAG: hypothetical protein EOP84_14180 [Verrucomicrobiaceae bacterium]|nr:MAG: hypothetical protein EOP84_14180 [Verrucomicrobiaceae bacterium]
MESGFHLKRHGFYVHLNKVIKKIDLDMISVSGPGYGGPAVGVLRPQASWGQL